MRIYEIDSKIRELLEGGVDEDTGEVLFDPELIEALQMERDAKVENLALAVKNLTAESEAIKAEEKALEKRRKVTDKEAERAKRYLDIVLKGDRFKSARVVVSYRKSTKLNLDNGFVEWAERYAPDFLRYKTPEADKTAITAAIKSGMQVQGAELVESQTIQIK